MNKYLVTTGLFFQTVVYANSASEAKKQVASGGSTRGMRAMKS